jgi:hypothetical protein
MLVSDKQRLCHRSVPAKDRVYRSRRARSSVTEQCCIALAHCSRPLLACESPHGNCRNEGDHNSADRQKSERAELGIAAGDRGDGDADARNNR